MTSLFHLANLRLKGKVLVLIFLGEGPLECQPSVYGHGRGEVMSSLNCFKECLGKTGVGEEKVAKSSEAR